MIIVAGGDSHVWGSELADSPHGGPNGYSRNTFAALLAGSDYNCTAYPGLGNKKIKNKVMDACLSFIELRVNPGVLVCWSWPARDSKLDSDDDIIELQNFLESYNIPYLFTCVDNCIVTDNHRIKWDQWYLFPSGIEPGNTLQPRGFYQWAVENKYSLGIEGHPLESAHHDAAILIKEKFDELVKKHL